MCNFGHCWSTSFPDVPLEATTVQSSMDSETLGSCLDLGASRQFGSSRLNMKELAIRNRL